MSSPPYTSSTLLRVRNEELACLPRAAVHWIDNGRYANFSKWWNAGARMPPSIPIDHAVTLGEFVPLPGEIIRSESGIESADVKKGTIVYAGRVTSLDGTKVYAVGRTRGKVIVMGDHSGGLKRGGGEEVSDWINRPLIKGELEVAKRDPAAPDFVDEVSSSSSPQKDPTEFPTLVSFRAAARDGMGHVGMLAYIPPTVDNALSLIKLDDFRVQTYQIQYRRELRKSASGRLLSSVSSSSAPNSTIVRTDLVDDANMVMTRARLVLVPSSASSSSSPYDLHPTLLASIQRARALPPLLRAVPGGRVFTLDHHLSWQDCSANAALTSFYLETFISCLPTALLLVSPDDVFPYQLFSKFRWALRRVNLHVDGRPGAFPVLGKSQLKTTGWLSGISRTYVEFSLELRDTARGGRPLATCSLSLVALNPDTSQRARVSFSSDRTRDLMGPPFVEVVNDVSEADPVKQRPNKRSIPSAKPLSVTNVVKAPAAPPTSTTNVRLRPTKPVWFQGDPVELVEALYDAWPGDTNTRDVEWRVEFLHDVVRAVDVQVAVCELGGLVRRFDVYGGIDEGEEKRHLLLARAWCKRRDVVRDGLRDHLGTVGWATGDVFGVSFQRPSTLVESRGLPTVKAAL